MSAEDRQDLPIPDYDHLPIEALRQRMRTLDASQLETLLAYEADHGDRMPVTEAMRHRLEQLKDGAEPSGGDPAGWTPETSDGTQPAAQTDSSTDAPPVNPPSQGVPTNPAQPR
jgi:hypothetical protein